MEDTHDNDLILEPVIREVDFDPVREEQVKDENGKPQFNDDGSPIMETVGNPAVEGFKIVYEPKILTDKFGLAQQAAALEDESLPWAEKVNKSVEIAKGLLAGEKSGWRGLTPKIVSVIAPEFVSPENVKAMEEKLAAKGRTEVRYSESALLDLCLRSQYFLTRLLAVIVSIAFESKKADEQQKNA